MNDFESQLAALLGADALVTDAGARDRYLVDWMRTTTGAAAAIVRPSSVTDVARCVAWCAQHAVGVVPQGGHTGLAGGGTPTNDDRQIVLSLERLNKIREVDAVSNTITVEAGVVLQHVQQAADAEDRLFPLSLGAEGSCQIGGCISSNAGGTAVLRYGNTRELVLGMEVVLPDGSVWSRLSALRKDNAGFDLKHLFIGTEGTLGIVTAAVLRLFPKPRQSLVALVSVPTAQAMLDLFVRVRNAFDAELTAFEFMTGAGVVMACSHLGRTAPVPADTPYVVLVELSSPHAGEGLTDALLQCLETAAESAVLTDAALAGSQQQADLFWAIRECVPEAMLRSHSGLVSAHDVSLPITRIPHFMQCVDELIGARWPQLATLVFGHVGDGNLHMNFVSRVTVQGSAFEHLAGAASEAMYQLVDDLGGSISAEHGIGTHKKVLLDRFAAPAHLTLMRQLKQTLDRRTLMNPHKVFGTE